MKIGAPRAFLLCLMLLAACGGGGGGGGTESTQTPYTLSVTVSGLNGTVVLQNNGADNLSVSANGSATFSATLVAGADYSVTVLTHSAGQSCSVTGGVGKMPAANISLSISCVTNTVGGTVSGLSGTVVLQNNGGGDLSISANGSFAFSGSFNFNQGYAVTVLTQPVAQNCSIAGGSGAVTGAVNNIAVTCVVIAPAAGTLALSFGYKQLKFTWPAVGGATFYRVSENPDGASGFAVVANNLAANSYNHSVVSFFARLSALYILEACNSAGCTASSPFSIAANLSAAVGSYVKASNAGAGDIFGTVSLSADGNTLAVGARNEDSGLTGVTAGAPNEAATGNVAAASGAVYVFVRSGLTWAQQAYVKASNTGPSDNFGFALALSGDGSTLAVGAPFEASAATGINNITPGQSDNSAAGAGAAYVFTRSGNNWSQQAYVKASNTGANDNFGWSVALSTDGNTLAVGARTEASAATGVNNVTPGQADNSAQNAGAVYVFTRSLTPIVSWSQQAYIKASNAGAGDTFGTSVALDGNGFFLAVGAPGESSVNTGPTTTLVTEANTGNGALNSGAVYVFSRSGAAWSQHSYIKASNAEASDDFGISVALSSLGTTLAVGAVGERSSVAGVSAANPTPATDNDAAVSSGAVYVFTRTLTWVQEAYIKASNPQSNDVFGRVVALSGDGNTLAVGAPSESGALTGIRPGAVDEATAGNSATVSGAVYLFNRSNATWTQSAYVKAFNAGANDFFGEFVALSGDGNTLAVGADGERSAATGVDNTNPGPGDNTALFFGAVYLY